MAQERLAHVSLNEVKINDSFWRRYTELVPSVILPFQWELINDRVVGAEKSYCIQNFRIAAGKSKGSHQGMVFQDTDVAKWLEAVAYSLAQEKNEELERTADEAIDLIAQAQCRDGYLNTYYTITGTKRWSDLFEGHELYTAGHMIEAAVAYYEATGKDKFLGVVRRFADYICNVFGDGEDQIPGYPGHPEVELALVKLYRVTGEAKYLDLARYFVDTRGRRPCYFLSEAPARDGNYIFPEFVDFDLDYAQAHKPLGEQTTAEGHAVRAVYLYSAMADLAGEDRDPVRLEQCAKIWENIVQKRMYLTGSIGSASYGERFTSDYDLPNDTNYSESCASVGLAMFSDRMFQNTRDGKYMDIVEKALYNTVLSGIALDGKHFFYVNPLEVVPEVAEHNPTMRHVKTMRQQWFGVACCPPNIARTLASLGNYMYAVDDCTVYSNLFIGSDITAELKNGNVRIQLMANYPASGTIRYKIDPETEQKFTFAVRRPGYSQSCSIMINGQRVESRMEAGYCYLERRWAPGDEVSVELDVAFRFVRSNPRLYKNIGRIALMKGPWVYCLEEADNGKYLDGVVIDAGTEIREASSDGILDGIPAAKFGCRRIDYSNTEQELYTQKAPDYKEDELTAIPYCLWNNRGKGEMLVWMRERL